MAENSSNYSGVLSLPVLLTVLFFYLKLTHQIDWYWWWVWSPMLFELGFILGVLIIAIAVIGVAALFDYFGGN